MINYYDHGFVSSLTTPYSTAHAVLMMSITEPNLTLAYYISTGGKDQIYLAWHLQRI